MLKYILSLVVSALLVNSVYSQAKSDTLTYYVRNDGSLVKDKVEADYVLFILPEVEKIYPVRGYYPDGKLKFAGSSRTRSINLVLEGSYITYFPNGKRQIVANVENGKAMGDELAYYPNGNLYTHVKHEKNKTILFECRDSTGTVLTQNGNGTWLLFDNDLNTVSAMGPVQNGARQGEWETMGGKVTYEKGELQKLASTDKQKNAAVILERTPFELESKYLPVDDLPVYKDGYSRLQNFIYGNMKYPEKDRKDSIGGQVYIGFFVDKDGKTSNFNVIHAPSATLGKEALRVAHLLEGWEPAKKNNKPIKAPFILSIYFSLDSLKERKDTTTKTFVAVDGAPAFPGGLIAFGKFLEKAIRYPDEDRANHVTGKVYLTFVVEKDGLLSNIQVMSAPSIGLAEEALRVIKLSPNWIPGSSEGKPVRVRYTVPITFSLGWD